VSTKGGHVDRLRDFTTDARLLVLTPLAAVG
jgi:hypothetical protein